MLYRNFLFVQPRKLVNRTSISLLLNTQLISVRYGLVIDCLKTGMDFHELLDIPQGDRRKYHDDCTVLVIALGGSRIWKSSGKYL